MDFCDGELFWDTELTWTNNSWPQFTECFQHLLLQMVPCVWLWVAGSVYICYLLHQERNVRPIKWLFITKMFFGLIVGLMYLLELVGAIAKSTNFNDDHLAPVLWIVSCIFHVLLLLVERDRSVIRSPIMFVFWSLASIASLVPFYSGIQLQTYRTDIYQFTVALLKYFSCTVLFLLNCFSEYYWQKPQGHNPETSASVLSILSFAWMDRLILKGFRRPLLDEDIFHLHPQDEALTVVTRNIKQWEKLKERNRTKLKRRKGAHNIQRKENENETSLLLSHTSSTYGSTLGDKPARSGLSNGQITTNGPTNIDKRRDESMEGEPGDQENEKVSFLWALVRSHWVEGVTCQLGMLVETTSRILSPFILGLLIDYTSNMGELSWHGYIYVLAMVLSRLLAASFKFTSMFSLNRLAVRVRSAATAVVFRKALTMTNAARKIATIGEIVNLMAVDAYHFQLLMNYMYWLWMSLIFLLVGSYLLYTVVGLAVLAGLGFIGIMFVINFFVMRKMGQYQDEIMEIKDDRVRLTSEVLNGIKVIKLYGWELLFRDRIKEIRERELRILWKYAILQGFETFAWLSAQFWMSYLMLITFLLTDSSHHLDANTSFLTLNYVNIIKLGINIMPIIVMDWIKAATSMTRMSRFLNTEDLKAENLRRDTRESLAVKMVDADFAWDKDELTTLRNINMAVKPGQLVAVVGTVGAGKSSLLSAMLGEMDQLKGYTNLNSSVAYVPQQAWIQNDTVMGNILFGKDIDERFYRQIIHACCMQPDLDIMPAGDQTEIGEKGVNLSGGQKQRVSLARAIFSQADIYLLDDPLSAVDSHVGHHIFEQVIGSQGILWDKTRIMVTHGIQWLPRVDYIYVITDGRISEAGSYENLISHNGPFSQFLTQFLTKEIEKGKDGETEAEENSDAEIKTDILRRLVSITSDNEEADVETAQKLKRLLSRDSEKHHLERSLSRSGVQKRSFRTESLGASARERSHLPGIGEVDNRLTSDEGAETGKVKWSLYWNLIKGFGWKQCLVVLILMVGYNVVINYADIFLTGWTDDVQLSNFTALPANSTQREDRNNYYIYVYFALGFLQTCFAVAYATLFQLRHVSCSRKFHEKFLDSILRAPMSFFDTTPMGRILNRFSQDVEVLDNDITNEAIEVVEMAFALCGILVIISYTLPVFLAFIVPILVMLYFMQQFYIRNSCQLNRIASVNKSPVFSHFSETLSGATVIRAYQEQARFISTSDTKIDSFQMATTAAYAVNAWMQNRLELMACLVILIAGIIAIAFRDSMTPGQTGLIITDALRISINMVLAVQIFGDMENHVVSVERIQEYSVLQSEAALTLESDEKSLGMSWPSRACVQFVGYSVRYREGLDLVLRNLTCTINAGEKVGIVGRTGAGKSSMMLALFRLVEPASGQILIDGVDIGSLGLHALRKNITILPQDPVMFGGSLRMNLNPSGDKSDDELWTALEHSHLKAFVQSTDKGLDFEIEEGGVNLSMGQRQLVCLARTLLRKTKILILDEATAAVDMETDDLIQKTIRVEFDGCTILTIAHRLNTVMDYDRILVLDHGQLVEFSSPADLLSNPSSVFFSMAREAKLVDDVISEKV